MPSTSSTNNQIHRGHGVSRQILVVLAIAIFLTAMALIILQNVLGPGAPKVLQSYNNGYADGARDAREEIGILPATENAQPSPSLSGIVTEISGNTIKIKSGSPSSEKWDNMPMERVVTINQDATITIQEIPSQDNAPRPVTFDPERNPNPSAPATSDNYETAATMADIAVGDLVQVTAATETDVRFLTSFAASSVIVIVLPQQNVITAPPPPPSVFTPEEISS